MTKRSPTDPESERLAAIKAAQAFVGDDEPTSAEEAAIMEELRRELPRADKALLVEKARSLAKRK